MKGQPGCSTICARELSDGADVLCVGNSATFNLDANIPTGTGFSTTWSVPSKLQVTSSTNSSVTVKGISSTPFGNITATIQNPCGANKVITRTIDVINHDPVAPSITATPTINCGKYSVQVTFPVPPAGTTYNWTITKSTPGSGSSSYSYSGTGGGGHSYIMLNGDHILWFLMVADMCGSSGADRVYELHIPSPCATGVYSLIGPAPRMQQGYQLPDENLLVFPNPSSKDWTVSIIKNSVTWIDLNLYDMTGKKVYSSSERSVNLNDFTVPNGNLPAGTYMLEVNSDQGSYHYKVVKE